jgi:hypothetical protein
VSDTQPTARDARARLESMIRTDRVGMTVWSMTDVRAAIDALLTADRAQHRDEVLTEAARQQRTAAGRLPEHLAAAAPLVRTTADLIDPGCRALFKPARIRDAATDLLAARTTTPQEH